MQEFNSKKEKKYSQIDNQCALPHQHLFLTHRGLNQANRNNSYNIWQAFGGCSDIGIVCTTHRSTSATLQFPEYGNKKKQNQSSNNNKLGDKNDELQSSLQKSKRKNVTFKIQDSGNKNQSKIGNSLQKYNNSQKSGQLTTGNGKININNYLQKKLTPQQQQKRQIFLKECYSIDKYLKQSKAYTRLMPNSAVKLFYQKPCIQAYGRKNTKGTSGFICNDFMKTHNVLPHRMSNQPKKYQSYRSALNFCKRTKIDPEQRWKKIHRQMRKKLDMKQLVQFYTQGLIDVNGDNLQQVLKLNINQMNVTKLKRSKSFDYSLRIPSSSLTNLPQKLPQKIDLNSTRATNDTKQPSQRIQSLKRSKSWGKKQHLFLYKYTDKQGNTQYCKDRHGITCYVDPTFQQNKEAFLKFQKRIQPIQAEDVDPSDRNIDQLLLNNFIQSKQQDVPKHYLLPNCQQPYRAQKYSWKARKQSLMATATTEKQ